MPLFSISEGGGKGASSQKHVRKQHGQAQNAVQEPLALSWKVHGCGTSDFGCLLYRNQRHQPLSPTTRTTPDPTHIPSVVPYPRTAGILSSPSVPTCLM